MIRNFDKLLEEYKKHFQNTKTRAGDLTYSELSELIARARKKAGREMTEEGKIGTAIILAWEAAFMAGYKRGRSDEKGAKV